MENTIIAISVAVIALSFLVLVVYIVKTLKTLRLSMLILNNTMNALKQKVDEIEGEGLKFLQHTNEVATDLQSKMKSLDALFHAISHVGEVLDNGSRSFKKSPASSFFASEDKQENHSNREKVVDILEWIVLGLSAWQNIKKRR